jgi:hypothetical protein
MVIMFSKGTRQPKGRAARDKGLGPASMDGKYGRSMSGLPDADWNSFPKKDGPCGPSFLFCSVSIA